MSYEDFDTVCIGQFLYFPTDYVTVSRLKVKYIDTYGYIYVNGHREERKFHYTTAFKYKIDCWRYLSYMNMDLANSSWEDYLKHKSFANAADKKYEELLLKK